MREKWSLLEEKEVIIPLKIPSYNSSPKEKEQERRMEARRKEEEKQRRHEEFVKQTEEKLMEQQRRVEARRREMEEKDKIRQEVFLNLSLYEIIYLTKT